MLDRATCDAAIEALVDDPQDVDAWFICGPGPMMDAAEAALVERKVAHDRIHIERFTAGRPSAAVAAQMASLQQEAAGLTIGGDARRADQARGVRRRRTSSTARATPGCPRRSRARPGCARRAGRA